MNENESENFDSTNEEEVELEETPEEEQEVSEPEEDIETLKKRIITLEHQKEHFKEKAKKPIESSTRENSDLTTKDLYSLMQANVAEEDIPEVQDYARLKGISIAEALKVPLIKSMLLENTEKRNVAEATHTGTSRRSNKQVSDDVLLSNARKGQMPDSDVEIERLFKARRGIK